MRCARAESLIERYLDGALGSALAQELEAHVRGCARCTASVEAAKRLAEQLAAEPEVRAPHGFAARVMDAVYRQALAGEPRSARAEQSGPARIPAPVYRRLGFSFLVAAGVLAISLLIPRVSYPTLVGTGNAAAAFADGSAGFVRTALNRADDAIQGILGEQPNGGTTR